MSEVSKEQREAHRLRNASVLSRLQALGSDLSLVHHVVHAFYSQDEGTASELVLILKREGYVIETAPEQREFEGERYWFFEAALRIVPQPDEINAMTDRLVDIATEVNCEYDGWFTQVV